ncbi:hypothetical protein B0T16DRAFT_10833, partial [Cercophora newfieldiana]
PTSSAPCSPPIHALTGAKSRAGSPLISRDGGRDVATYGDAYEGEFPSRASVYESEGGRGNRDACTARGDTAHNPGGEKVDRDAVTGLGYGGHVRAKAAPGGGSCKPDRGGVGGQGDGDCNFGESKGAATIFQAADGVDEDDYTVEDEDENLYGEEEGDRTPQHRPAVINRVILPNNNVMSKENKERKHGKPRGAGQPPLAERRRSSVDTGTLSVSMEKETSPLSRNGRGRVASRCQAGEPDWRIPMAMRMMGRGGSRRADTGETRKPQISAHCSTQATGQILFVNTPRGRRNERQKPSGAPVPRSVQLCG